jgi:cell shape-determining protein MreC
VPSDVATQEEVDAVTDQLADLTEAVNRQNELLKKQHAAMKQLITELRQERNQ